MPLVAGVDSSTQSSKVEVRDADTGALVADGRAHHPVTTPPRSEQDPAAWWTAFEAAWAMAGAPDVAAIAVGGQQHGMVVLDADGAVIRPAKLWNDTESAPDAGWLLRQLPDGAAGWAAACGSVPVAAFTITKLSWLHRCEPEQWSRLAKVLLPHDWLTGQLTGEFMTDRGDASGTGYWSPAAGEYRWDLLAIVDAERDWTDGGAGGPRPARGGRDVGQAVVAPGTGDNMAAALGLGLAPGDVAVSIGTSGTVYAVSDAPTADPTGAVAGFADATGRFLPLVCTLNATKVTDAVARLLGVDLDGLDTLALGEQPGAGGVVLLPYLDGERTPNRPTRPVCSPGCGRTSAASSWRAPPSRASCAGCSTGSTPLSSVAETGARPSGAGGRRCAVARLPPAAGRPLGSRRDRAGRARARGRRGLRPGRRGPPPAPARGGERGVGPLGRHGGRTRPGTSAAADVRAAYAARRDAEA